jgi:hypothetical protein
VPIHFSVTPDVYSQEFTVALSNTCHNLCRKCLHNLISVLSCFILAARTTQGVASVPTSEPITSVEEFVPDGGVLDRSFLEDTNIHERGTAQHLEAESDR